MSKQQSDGGTQNNWHCKKYYTVSTKKLWHCIRCHNSGKRRRILTKFYNNTESLHCKKSPNFRDFGDISCTSWLIADFVLNFIAMAKWVIWGKLAVHENHKQNQKLRLYLGYSRRY